MLRAVFKFGLRSGAFGAWPPKRQPFYRKLYFWKPSSCLGALEAQGRPVLELHAQGQATRGQYFFNLVKRLTTQVGGLEQFVLGALNEIADVVDVLCLEAVGRSHRKLEVVDRTQQNGVDLRRATAWGHFVVAGAFQCSKDRNLVHQDAGRLTYRFLGRN